MRVAWVYLALVGLPILGLISVLEFGKGIRAPVSVAGQWRAEISSDSGVKTVCRNISLDHTFTINVTQSGLNVTLSFTNDTPTRMTGTIIGAQVTAYGVDSSLQLTADIDKACDPDLMSGSFVLAGCENSDPVSFIAIRSSEPHRTAQGR